mgnify:CR=1 FL=1
MQKYLTFNDLRKRLGNRSRSAIYSDLRKGNLPEPLHLGNRLLWGEQDLAEFLDELKEIRSPSDVCDGSKDCQVWSDNLLQRNREIISQRRSGLTLQKIANNWSINRERVRQIIFQHNKANKGD